VSDLLAGVRVLEAGSFLAAPYAAQLLADWGADVIKVEPLAGDASRGLGTGVAPSVSSTFAAVNRGKRSVALDLRSEDGRGILRRLAARSDAIVHNHPPAVAAKLGLDHPSAVVCAVSAFGDGSHRPALDPVLQAVSGLSALTGDPAGEPMRCAAPVVDVGTGLAAAATTLAGLYRRSMTGRGAAVEVALFDVALAFQGSFLAEHGATGEPPPRRGNGSFAVLGDQFAVADGFVALAVWDDERWSALCTLLGVEPLAARDEFASNDARLRNYAALRPLLADAIARWSAAPLCAALAGAGIACGVTRDLAAVADDPLATALFRRGDALLVGGPSRVGGERPVASRPPPRVGEHTLEVIAEVLGAPLLAPAGHNGEP
jgi:glutaryl-CoA transferase